MILNSEYLEDLLGEPLSAKAIRNLSLFMIPQNYRNSINCLPYKIYCNPCLYKYLLKGLDKVIYFNLADQIKTWDGCYNVRKTRGGKSLSLHSWGLAFDINSKENPMNKAPKMSSELVGCFSEWFDWGGNFLDTDGMHFQLKREFLET